MQVSDDSSVELADEDDRWGMALAADLSDEELEMTAFSTGDALDPDRISRKTGMATVGVMCTTPLVCNC